MGMPRLDWFILRKSNASIFNRMCLIAVLGILILSELKGQTRSVSMSFHAVLGEQKLRKDSAYVLKSGLDTVRIDVFRFYISNVQFLSKGKVVNEQKERYFLVDVFDSTSCKLSLLVDKAITYDHVRFNLGIDSTTNVSGVMGGSLDPTRGMYWTWQSGYINMKLEGYSTRCIERNKRFQYHLGGYAAPFNSLQTIELGTGNVSDISIAVDANHFLSEVDTGELGHVMSPCAKAVALSQTAVTMFSVRK
jgi:hypothetical protein